MPKNGKVSEEMFKNEAITFFKLSTEQSTKFKAEFKRQIEKYVTMHKNVERGLNREIMRDNGGTGNHWDNPPNHFEVQIQFPEHIQIYNKSNKMIFCA